MSDANAPLAPALAALGEYPFARLVAERKRRQAAGQRIIDFGMGDPRERTPDFIRHAMIAGIPEISSYPTVAGEPALRAAIASWYARRFGVTLDPATEILPTQGSKEGIFHTAFPFIDAAHPKRAVLIFEPAYPVYEAGARYAGAEVIKVVLDRARGYIPDLDAIGADTWKRTRIVWLNTPHNPTGHVVPLATIEKLHVLARQHGFILAVDECYVDLYFGAPPRSALEVGRDHMLVYHSLSKRSAMTGFRSGFIAGDRDLIAVLSRFRPGVGCAMPEFVQAASIAAWNDDAHTHDMRAIYRAKRECLLPVLERAGLVDDGGDTTFYLWMLLPAGVDDALVCTRMLEHGVLLCPGSYLGRGGSGTIRVALVPDLAACQVAARLIEQHLPAILKEAEKEWTQTRSK